MNCCWCGANADDSNSHGICQSCALQLLLQSEQRQFDKVESYVEANARQFARECEQSPYSIEIHSDSGHAFLPGSYEDVGTAIETAQMYQTREMDASTFYLVSDRDQDIVWEKNTNG